jgi:hypothetical protein
MHPPWRWSGSRGIGFDSQSVVHGSPELLLASEVALCRLNRDVPEQELNLVQFATREMAETGTRASEVVGEGDKLPDDRATQTGAERRRGRAVLESWQRGRS